MVSMLSFITRLSRRHSLAPSLLILGLIFLFFIFFPHSPGVRVFQPRSTYRPLNLSSERVLVYEEGVHDEVIGAIGSSLEYVGIRPIYDCHFRHGFGDILPAIVGYEPLVENPHWPEKTIVTRLAEDTIDHLVLTTCHESLKRWQTEILASSAHVVCFFHHGGVTLERFFKTIMLPLAEQKRISLIVLGNHVQEVAERDLWDWAERETVAAWGTVPIELLAPVFDYPRLYDKEDPSIFPTTAIVQGNLDTGRRHYLKLFADLMQSISASPAVWGYRPAEAGSPFMPDPDASPFQLLLLGQMKEKDPLQIPIELEEVVSIHEGLSFNDYYHALAKSDILIPAFAHRGYFENTASSSMGAGVIARVPSLVSRRHLRSYGYIEGPAMILRNVSDSEIRAIEQMRMCQRPPRPDRSRINLEWDHYLEQLNRRNAEVWARLITHGIASRQVVSTSNP